MNSEARGPIAHQSFGPDLYSGTTGIALFLASLFRLVDERLVRKTAEAAAAQAYSRADTIPARARIGIYSGTLGIAWSLINIGELLRCTEWQERGISLVDELARTDIDGQGMDLISGCAGAIPVLLELSHRFGRPSWAGIATQCGELLERASARSPEGWSSRTVDVPSRNTGRNLTGFSHGTAGIGWALLELGCHLGTAQFCHASQEAFRYERTHYSAKHENWPDFRDLRPFGSSHAPVFATTWCHGAPGISLSRLRAWELTKEAAYRDEAECALRTTARALESLDASSASFCLCHGHAGNADVLLEAASILGITEYHRVAEDVGRKGIEEHEDKRLTWPCGVPGAGETKNLMLGTAGIGYFYLRLYDPRTPTLLMIGSRARSKQLDL